jgi:hypothetical protein
MKYRQLNTIRNVKIFPAHQEEIEFQHHLHYSKNLFRRFTPIYLAVSIAAFSALPMHTYLSAEEPFREPRLTWYHNKQKVSLSRLETIFPNFTYHNRK